MIVAMDRLQCGQAVAAASDLGGELTSYVAANGREYLWNGDPAYWPSHGPILFPVVGSTVDGKVRIGGVECVIPKHGFPRNEVFRRTKLEENAVEYTYEPGEASRAGYPFDYDLRVTHVIQEDGFATTYAVENRSEREMPFCIGGHPGFAVPLFEGDRFEDYIVKFECVEDGENTLAPGGGYITGTAYLEGFRNSDTLRLSHSLFDPRDALIFDKIKSRKVWLLNEKTGKGLEFSFPKFPALGIWTPPGKNAPFVCLEPWMGLPALEGESGDMEDKPYVRVLKPGEGYETGYAMKVVD